MDNTRFSPKHDSFYLGAMLLFVYFWIPNSIALASAQGVSCANREAEKWVIEQVELGIEADLITEYPDEENRMICAEFLQNLLTDSLGNAKVHWRGVRIKNAIVTGVLDLENAEIPHETQLSSCHFKEAVTLKKAVFRKSLVVVNSTFQKSVNFNFAEISGNFEADGARFTGVDKELLLDKQKGSGRTGRDSSSGRNPAKETPAILTFTDMKVGGGAFFRDAIFETPVDFSYAEIGGSFEANGATFMGADQKPAPISKFTDMKVRGGAFFRDAIFKSSVDFSYADISGNFEADRCEFMATTEIINFNRIKVGEQAIFRGVNFAGGVSLKDATIFDLILSLESWPPLADSDSTKRFRLDGMTYQHISAGGGNERELSENLLELFKNSEYSLSGYTNLEAYFQRQGEPEMADKAFIDRKKRERKSLGGLAWLWNLSLYVLVCYGRRPELAFIWGALIVSVGCYVFRRKQDMELQKLEAASQNYNPLWYSLDLFLPFIDLQVANVWLPKQRRHFARHYMRVQTILGWILIPIGLAALTGIIK
jgi:uncharacterized protein YjbI with pentapeptide repeats